MKLPAMMLYPGDWLKDPALSACSPATRGIWFDCLCAMHELGRAGELRGTPEGLARITRCQPAEFVQAATELQITQAADVTFRNGVYVLINRRMRREFLESEDNAERQRRFRQRHGPPKSNEKVTPSRARRLNVSSSTSFSKRLNVAEPPDAMPPPENPNAIHLNRSTLNRSCEEALMGRLRNCLGELEMSASGGHWRIDHVRKHPGLLDRALAEVERMKKEGESFHTNAAACLEDLIKRWTT